MMGGRAADRLVYSQPYSRPRRRPEAGDAAGPLHGHALGHERRLGPMSFRIGEEHVFLGKEIQEPRDFSEGTAQVIDEEVQKLLRAADEKAYQLLQTHRPGLDKIVDALLEREDLDKKDIDELLSPPDTRREPSVEPSGPPKAGAGARLITVRAEPTPTHRSVRAWKRAAVRRPLRKPLGSSEAPASTPQATSPIVRARTWIR